MTASIPLTRVAVVNINVRGAHVSAAGNLASDLFCPDSSLI